MFSESMASSSNLCEQEEEEEDPIDQGSPRRRAKEDLSELTKTLSSKLWCVASFLAPSPSADSLPLLRNQDQETMISGESGLMETVESGIRSDFAEIGGSIKTGIARISNNVGINGISKIASSFLAFKEEEEEILDYVEDYVEEEEEYEDLRDVIGVTDEVLAFARNIACHPETWLDFPVLSDDEDDFDDFDMSVAQQDHALAIESLAPRLAALRIELCPTHMSIGCFWKIYFALLHPRLNKHDADLLSTPQIVEARAMLQHGLQSQAKQGSEDLRRHLSFRDAEDGSNSQDNFANFEAEFVDKFVVNEEPCLQNKIKGMALEGDDYEDDNDDDEWPEDETQDENNTAGIAAILACNEEDISFSDLEEEEYCFTKQDFSRIVSKSENTLNK